MMLTACNDNGAGPVDQGDGVETGSGSGGSGGEGIGSPPAAPFPEPPAAGAGPNGRTDCPEASPAELFASEQGEGTWYDVNATGQGACGLPAPDDGMIAAINDPQYADSAACGACLAVAGPLGEVVVKVVDRCPECQRGDLDLSKAAFAQIADPAQGRVQIRWHETPCNINDPLRYHFKDGANPDWVAIQVRNHRNRIARLEALGDDNRYHVIPRAFYNYFVAEQGLGQGPLTFRVTDIFGNQIEDGSIVLQANGDSQSHSQFPACDATP